MNPKSFQTEVFLECPICCEDYNLVERIPRVMPCGHTFCTRCLKGLIEKSMSKCPLDGKPFLFTCSQCLKGYAQPQAYLNGGNDFHNADQVYAIGGNGFQNADQVYANDGNHFQKHLINFDLFPVNFQIRDQIEENLKWEICKIHQRRIETICMVDKSKICLGCIVFGDHKDHSVKPIMEIKSEIENKKLKLETLLDSLEQQCKKQESSLEQVRLLLLERTEKQFDSIILSLNKKKTDTLLRINEIFKQEKDTLNQDFGNNSSIKNSINNKITIFNELITAKDFFPLWEDNNCNLSSDLLADKFKVFEDRAQEVSENLQKAMKDLLKLISIPIDPFKLKPCSLNFPERESCLNIKTHAEDLEITFGEKKPVNFKIDFAEWKNVKGLKIRLDKCTINGEDMLIIRAICSRLPQIERIKVNGEGQSSISEKHLTDLFSEIFIKPQGLKEIDINFWNSKVGEKSLVLLAETVFPKILDLRTIKLNLYNTPITDTALVPLIKSILAFKDNLDSISLCLGNTSVTEKGVTGLFTNMPKVKNFELNLRGIRLSDQGLEEFVKSTLPSMKMLENLGIYLYDTKVTDQSISKLFENLQDVKKLSLDLTNTRVSDESVEMLLNSKLFKMENLKSLSLTLNNTDVTEKTKIKVTQTLAKYKDKI